MITEKQKTEFWILTDTHLIADRLHDDGAAFKRMQDTSQGKDLMYQEIALRAFCQFANVQKPAAIIITGDLTFNGELISAQRLQKIFAALTETKLLVLPGNHDIFDGWARAFHGKQQFYTAQISPAKWRQIFQESYACARNQDQHSLAYSVKFNPQYLLLLLDSNLYGKREAMGAPITAGEISPSQLKWLEKQLQQAQEQTLQPLLFLHHNLYLHNPAVNRGFVLNNAADLRALCRNYQVKAAFSGHIHAQNIVEPQSPTPTTEIVTSSFCSYDQAYGVVTVEPDQVHYERRTFTMLPYLTQYERQKPELAAFPAYLKQIQLRNLAANLDCKDQKQADQVLFKRISQMLAEFNYNYFTGHNHISERDLTKLTATAEYQTLIKKRPRVGAYFKTLFDTSSHSNLTATISYRGKDQDE